MPVCVNPADVNPDDISELLSKNRSPFPKNLIMSAAAGPDDGPENILDISRPLSPLQESPPARTKSYRSSTRTSKKTQPIPTPLVDSSDDEAVEAKIKIVQPQISHQPSNSGSSRKKRGSEKQSPRVRPQKTALAQVSKEDQIQALPELPDLPEPKKITSSKSKNGKVASTSGHKKSRKSGSITPQSNSAWALSSSSDVNSDPDDEAKDASYGSYRKSPTKRKSSTKSTPNWPNPETLENSTVEESAKKRAAISRIFPVKKSTPHRTSPASNGASSTTPTCGSGSGGGKSIEIKSEPISILKRLDGRPVLICRIPLDAIHRSGSSSGSKKRERKLSTASTSSNSSSSKKKAKSNSNKADVKPEATSLGALPGYPSSSSSSGSNSASNNSTTARNLMPPPNKKVENQEANESALPTSNHFQEDEFQVN